MLKMSESDADDHELYDEDSPEQGGAPSESEVRLVPKISYLAAGCVGKPAPTEDRPVTDHSFDYSLSLSFKTMADHEFYQKDCPDHLRFVKNCKAFFEKVIVYDTEVLA